MCLGGISMHIYNINSVNFNSRFNMSTKDGRALSEAVREYAKTSSEEARLRAFDVFDKYMVKDAQKEAENGYIYEEYLQKLRLNFLEKLEHYKDRDERISTGICNSMDYVVPTDEDKTLDNIEDGFISLGKNFSKKEASACRYMLNNIEEKEQNDYLYNIINNKNLFAPYQSDMLYLYYMQGYSAADIADEYNLSRERVRQILEKVRIKFAIESNVGNVQEGIKSELIRAFKKNGCEMDDNGKFVDDKQVHMALKKNNIDYPHYYNTKYLAEGKSFREVSSGNYKSLLDIVKIVLRVLNRDEK